MRVLLSRISEPNLAICRSRCFRSSARACWASVSLRPSGVSSDSWTRHFSFSLIPIFAIENCLSFRLIEPLAPKYHAGILDALCSRNALLRSCTLEYVVTFEFAYWGRRDAQCWRVPSRRRKMACCPGPA
jgi:hypothetical protein